jgi:hypothetical protein
MKFKLSETDGVFVFEASAENMEDAAKIVRLGMNGTQRVRFSSFVDNAGSFVTSLVIVKHKRSTGYVQKRK